MLVKPDSTPPVPAKAPTFSSPHKMPPYFLLHPILYITKTSTGMPYPKVINPASEFRVDQPYHAFYRLRHESLENLFEIPQEICPCLHPRGDAHSQFATQCSGAPYVGWNFVSLYPSVAVLFSICKGLPCYSIWLSLRVAPATPRAFLSVMAVFVRIGVSAFPSRPQGQQLYLVSVHKL